MIRLPLLLIRRSTALSAALLLGGLTVSCQGGTPSSTISPPTKEASTDQTVDQPQVLSNFANQVIIPTYQRFADQSKALSGAIAALAQNPTPQTLKTAQEAWVTARSSWEQSESFTFGPAGSLGYDGALDSWPIDETDLKKVLDSRDQFTPEYVAKLPDTDKGFHAIEYLLFGKNKDKQGVQFDPRQLEYLQALGNDFSRVAHALLASWQRGVAGQPAYREVIATAGDSNNTTYPTAQAGIEEIVNGMIDSLDEVAQEKIGKPLAKKDPTGLESRFSQNTLNDIEHNIQGAKNVYLGRFPAANTSSGANLSAYVAQLNPALDQKIKAQFQAAMTALEKIPAPLESAILDPQSTTAIRAAQEDISKLHGTLKQDVLPLMPASQN
jgi:putative iron-regulated protein